MVVQDFEIQTWAEKFNFGQAKLNERDKLIDTLKEKIQTLELLTQVEKHDAQTMTTIIGSHLDKKSDSESSRAMLEKNGSKSSRVGGGYQKKPTFKPLRKNTSA